MITWNESGNHVIYTNDTAVKQFVVYVSMGGSGFATAIVSPNDQWREGAGEEYCDSFPTEDEAERYIQSRLS